MTEVASVIRSVGRLTDVAARFGRDEFTMILPETDENGAIAVAERVAERLRQHIFLASDGLAVRLTASIGVATLPGVARTAEDLLHAADASMYHVKDHGKDGYHVAHGSGVPEGA